MKEEKGDKGSTFQAKGELHALYTDIKHEKEAGMAVGSWPWRDLITTNLSWRCFGKILMAMIRSNLQQCRW